QGKITAVELDLKDESGFIRYDSTIPLAHEADAVVEIMNLRDAIDELHSRGVRVIGRLVAFRDPILAQHAWQEGDLDWVIQDLNGSPLSKYGGFTNFNHEAVRQYNLDIAIEAAEAGIDDILWDYIRRPEGNLQNMNIPGLGGDDPAPVIVDFLADTQVALRQYDVFQGVSVFGIAATRGEYIAQDVQGMAPYVDYVAPMLYPSHWGPGEYGVADPESQPYDIVRESLADFQQVLEGTNTTLVPWLQDFTMHVDYGPEQIQAQIQAAADLGIDSWLLWDPLVTYTADGMLTSSAPE
ncbi:MAG: putative glycoside hydrolase, partial [Actinomycetota bacterium]|nr:putative glycoside hydrolase [Actinomycetota bacterium]